MSDMKLNEAVNQRRLENAMNEEQNKNYRQYSKHCFLLIHKLLPNTPITLCIRTANAIAMKVKSKTRR